MLSTPISKLPVVIATLGVTGSSFVEYVYVYVVAEVIAVSVLGVTSQLPA